MSEQKKLYKVAGYKEDDRITNPLYNMAVKGKLPDGIFLEMFLKDICVRYTDIHTSSIRIWHIRRNDMEHDVIHGPSGIFGMVVGEFFIDAEQTTSFLQKIFTEKWTQFRMDSINAVFGSTVHGNDYISSYLVNESMMLWALMDGYVYALIVTGRKQAAINQLWCKFKDRGQEASLIDCKTAIEFVQLMRPIHPEEE